MKKVTRTCDVCQKTLGREYIKLGNEDEQELYYENNMPDLKEGVLRSMGRHSSVHFCSKDHFIKYFFERD